MMRRQHHRSPGQALVEFALAATLIFFLLAAAVDLGLIFFTMQNLRTAAQEGATFGSRPIVCPDENREDICGKDDTTIKVLLDEAEIKNRVRLSAGGTPRGFVNLLDLDNNGVTDDQAVINDRIRIDIPFDRNRDGNPSETAVCSPTLPPSDPNLTVGKMRDFAARCYVRVTIRYTYRFIFPLAPAFANEVVIPVSYAMQVRSNYKG